MFESILAVCQKQACHFIIFLLRLYQWLISPLLGPRCRFYPNCSQYAIEALKKHRFFFALWLILKRLLRCQPFCKGGIDPVPQRAQHMTLTQCEDDH